MYIPAHFRNENEAELLEFMQAHSFGILVSCGAELPFITHLPFTIENNGRLILTSHFAAANPQSKQLQNGSKVTVVFSGPHSYISPSLYDKSENVPTWNYVAVHAHGIYGTCSDNEKEEVLRKMIAAYEPSYEKQYDQLSDKYRDGLKEGIVAFRIVVDKLEGKYKLSQNKNPNERQRITEHLAADSTTEQLAEYMRKK